MLERKEILAEKFKKAGASGKKIHIMARQGNWVVFREGGDKAIAIYDSKSDALKSAQEYLLSGKAEALVLHNIDGSVEKLQPST